MRGDAVRGGGRRRRAWYACRRFVDKHLYRVPGSFALMIPNMYKIAGELLARRFSCFGARPGNPRAFRFSDHQDVMGLPPDRLQLPLLPASVQECMDLRPRWPTFRPLILRCRSAISSMVPHPRTKCRRSMSLITKTSRNWSITTGIEEFRASAMNPEHPAIRRHGPESGYLFPEHGSLQSLL